MLSNGCTLYVDFLHPSNLFLLPLVMTDASGSFSTIFPIPFDTSLDGVQIVFQARICAPSGPIGPFFPDWASNGVQVTLGCISPNP